MSTDTKTWLEDYRADATTKRDRLLKTAAQRLVSSFHEHDHDAISARIGEEQGTDSAAMPMWGTIFKVGDPCDERSIRNLLTSMAPDDDDIEAILVFNADGGLGVDVSDRVEMALCEIEGCANWEGEMDYIEGTTEDSPVMRCMSCERETDPEYDTEGLRQDVMEAWSESGQEDYWLMSAGWQAVGGTGLVAVDLDGDIYIGADSAGHSFYSAYWIPLYLALGYSWHEQSHREDVIADVVRRLASPTEEQSQEDPNDTQAILELRKVYHLEYSALWHQAFGDCPAFCKSRSGV